MKLLDHLKATGETVDDFAKRISEPLSTIRKIAYGQRQPSLPLAVKIEASTDGEVRSADMVLINLGPASATSPGNVASLSDQVSA